MKANIQNIADDLAWQDKQSLQDQPIGPSRGIVNGLLLGAVIWVLIVAAVWMKG